MGNASIGTLCLVSALLRSISASTEAVRLALLFAATALSILEDV